MGRIKISKNLLLLLLSLIAGLVISEIVASNYVKTNKLIERLKYVDEESRKSKFPDIGIYDKDLGWGLKPNTQDLQLTSDFKVLYSINSKGLRDKEIPAEKPAEEFRVVVLGESNVFGSGINYGRRFTELVEKSLRNVKVVNMGVRGYGIDQALLHLKRDGFQFKPNLVILFVDREFLARSKYFLTGGQFKPRFVLNNDKSKIMLEDMDFIKNKFKLKNTLEPKNSSPVKNRNKKNDIILMKSRLLTLLTYNKLIKEAQNEIRNLDKDKWASVHQGLKDEGRRMFPHIVKDDDFRELIYLIIKEYGKTCNERAVGFIIVNMDCKKIDYLSQFCQELGVNYLDLSDILFEASKVEPIKFNIDPHYNEFAHKIIGEHTSNYIENKYSLQKTRDYAYEG